MQTRFSTRLCLELFWLFATFTLLYLPWDPYKLCWKEIFVFYYSLKNLTDWHDESLQCCCHTITRSCWKPFGHWQCLPCFICLEILTNFAGNKNYCSFTKDFFWKARFFFFIKIWPNDMMSLSMLLSHNNNSFTSEAFIVIGDVYLASFAMRSLKTLLEGNICFLLKIFFFSICLTSNKLYWIED